MNKAKHRGSWFDLAYYICIYEISGPEVNSKPCKRPEKKAGNFYFLELFPQQDNFKEKSPTSGGHVAQTVLKLLIFLASSHSAWIGLTEQLE